MWQASELPTVSLIECDDKTADLVLAVSHPLGLRVRRFTSALTFLQQFDPSEPGCALADFNMSDRGGWELVDVVGAEAPGLQIVFYASGLDVATAVELMKAGVSDILTQPLQKSTLHTSIKRAVELDVRNKRAYAAQASARRHYMMLTPREREVFHLVVSGLPSKGIAQVLDRSQKTIEVHRTSIMKKMEAKSVVDLVRMGIELHVLDSDHGYNDGKIDEISSKPVAYANGRRPMIESIDYQNGLAYTSLKY